MAVMKRSLDSDQTKSFKKARISKEGTPKTTTGSNGAEAGFETQNERPRPAVYHPERKSEPYVTGTCRSKLQ